MRALVAAPTVPEPDRDSGSRRIDDALGHLQRAGWEVTFVSTQPQPPGVAARRLQQRGIPVFHLDPLALGRLVKAVDFRLALLCFWHTGELFMPVLRGASPNTRVIVDSIDLHFVRHGRRQLGSGQPLTNGFIHDALAELAVYSASDGVFTVSATEADIVHGLLGQPDLCFVVPDAEDLPLIERPFEERSGVLFVGSFQHTPNVEGLSFLCREVVPLIDPEVLGRHPFSIVGSGLSPAIENLAAGVRGVNFVGWVPELAPYYGMARASVLPLVSGAGTKRKLLQAMLYGTPAVTTSIGAEGFGLQDGRHAVIADDPLGLARGLETVLSDEAIWRRLAHAGREHALEQHRPDAARDALVTALDQVLARPAKQAWPRGTGTPDHGVRMRSQHEQLLIASAGEHRGGPAGNDAADRIVEAVAAAMGRSRSNAEPMR
jgi:O-antigen biosynthesis protein